MKIYHKLFAICVIFLAHSIVSAQNYPAEVKKLVNKAGNAHNVGEYELAIQHLEAALVLQKKQSKESYAEQAGILMKMGVSYDYFGDGKASLTQLQNALKLAQKSKDKTVQGQVHLNLGNYYDYRDDFPTTLKHYQSALRLFRETKDDYSIAGALINLSIPLNTEGNYYKAIQYLERAEQILSKLEGEFPREFSVVNNNIGSAYNSMQQYAKALPYLLKGLEYKEKYLPAQSPRLIVNYNSIAYAYINLKDYQKAGTFLKKVFKNKDKLKNDRGFANTLYYQGLIHKNRGEEDQALKYIQESTRLLSKLYGERHSYVASNYHDQSSIYLQKKDYTQALKTVHQAIEKNMKVDKTIKKGYIPQYEEALYGLSMIEFLEHRGMVYKSIFLDKSKDIKDLKLAFQNFKACIDYIRQSAVGIDDETVVDVWGNTYKKSYFEAIDCAYLLFKHTKKQNYLSKAFQIVEQSKAYVLAKSLHETEIQQTWEDKDPLFVEDQSLRSKINLAKQNLAESKKNQDKQTKKYQQELFTLNHQRDSLLQIIQQKYPEYYEVKYNFTNITLKDIQDSLLHKNEILLEYIIQENTGFVFQISPQKITLHKISAPQSFNQLVNTLQQSLQKDDFKTFHQVSYQLHQSLIAPLNLSKKDIQKLRIIPDGVLYYLPFDILIRKPYTGTKTNYKALDYLVHDYQVTYDYSAQIAFRNITPREKSYKLSFLGIAPEFQANTNTTLERSNLGTLSASKQEVAVVYDIFKGKALYKNQANESEFNKWSKQSLILHFATHAIVDNENPAYSRLVLAPGKDTNDEDGYLHVFELYDLGLNAELVTLSACNTGQGVLREGEGVMSLGRSFAHANCPNLVVSLWNTSDQASVEIMTLFYTNLAKGLPKDKALQEAKINFLKNADNIAANPKLWGSFVFMGNPDPLSLQPLRPFYQKDWFWRIMIFVTIGVFLFIFVNQNSWV